MWARQDSNLHPYLRQGYARPLSYGPITIPGEAGVAVGSRCARLSLLLRFYTSVALTTTSGRPDTPRRMEFSVDAMCDNGPVLKRSSKITPRDLNLLAAAIVGEATGNVLPEEPDDRDPHAVALGKKGGAKGGPARAAALSPERRREIAQQAARARWAKQTEREEP